MPTISIETNVGAAFNDYHDASGIVSVMNDAYLLAANTCDLNVVTTLSI